MTRGDEADKVYQEIIGDNPHATTTSGERQAMRKKIGEMVRGIILDRGMDPFVTIEMLIAGCAFLGDNYGVSRDQMCRALSSVSMRDDRTLIVKPG